MKKSRLAIFASGNGSNAETIIKYFQDHKTVEVGVLLCNNSNALVIERAKKFKIPVRIFDRIQFQQIDSVISWSKENEITHIVLAGFLLLIPEKLINVFPDRIVNIHPSLLPKFGGKGMYGMKVHEAVAAGSEQETGITIHLVNAHYDEGKILAQAKCPVLPTDDAKVIAGKVTKLEHEYYPKVIENWANPLSQD